MFQLPEGWTIERVQALAQGQAELLKADTPARLRDGRDEMVLSPTCAISFSGLCLVRDAADGTWYMGEADTDGTIVCWSGYGDDLEEAIRSL